ncbi:MAG: hypothetical protein IKK59_05120 [Lachnospiraceae bacterium]|nr:hypothetical protein [Lachnospiraceae bacterium]
MIKKKNGFLTFIFSLVPGAGEMYMGFMKQGVSLMSMFFAVIFLTSWMRADILMCAGIVIWCYSFFHVHNLRGLPDAEFQAVEDKILVPFHNTDINFNFSNKKLQTVGAVVLILVGASMLWNYLLDLINWSIMPEWLYHILWNICYGLPEAVIGVLIIWFGIRLIKGKKKALEGEL